MCDRIISPMKGAIRRYCNEGHDIVRATDMHEALKMRQVNGSTAAVCELDRDSKEVKINRIRNFSSFHNFVYEKEGLRLSKAYGVGKGRLIPWSELIIEKQKPMIIKEIENHGFFATVPRAIKSNRNNPESSNSVNDELVLQCPEPGCCCEFVTSEELEDHVHLGEHHKPVAQEGLYDSLRRDWASKFSTLTLESKVTPIPNEGTGKVTGDQCSMGWALQKPRGGGARFSEDVRSYLSERFETGERTGRKADPSQVASDMRKARDANGARKFKRTEWLTKTQVQSYFSRLSALKRRSGAVSKIADEDDDDESLIEEELSYLEDKARQKEEEYIVNELAVVHPITYDGHNICEHVSCDTLRKFNVSTLRAMCTFFEIPYKNKDLKASLLEKLKDMVQECSCFQQEMK